MVGEGRQVSSSALDRLGGHISPSPLDSLFNFWSQAISELFPMNPVARADSSLLKSSSVWSMRFNEAPGEAEGGGDSDPERVCFRSLPTALESALRDKSEAESYFISDGLDGSRRASILTTARAMFTSCSSETPKRLLSFLITSSYAWTFAERLASCLPELRRISLHK